ncbi:MAG TPA: sugar ABC transporter substrate-binding protein [Anaerolineae bacterium]|nr:sugar ABC transporter substrate-binding protein [Anaerolineae bacterium]HOQ99259.1 sugar ABC transporter substrate-binding protein [Anaerolineae bacterium]
MTRVRNILLLVVVLSLALAGCTPKAGPQQPAPTQAQAQPEPTQPQVAQSKLTFGLAVHSNPAEDAFWAVVEKGAKDAAATYGVTLKSGGNPDPAAQAQLVEDYVAAKVDGIIVSLSHPDAMKDALKKATDAGIPIITINSGVGVYKELGAIAHVGQTELIAGEGAGEKFNEAGAKKVLIVFHEEGNVGLEERAQGVGNTFKGTVDRLNAASTGVRDLAGSLAAIQNKLIATPDIDAILTLNATMAMAAKDAVKAAGGKQMVATFDVGPDALAAIEKGEMLFAIDQQQYLQGYLPIIALYLYKTNLNTIGGGLPVLTGPGFITKDNASAVKALAEKGTR